MTAFRRRPGVASAATLSAITLALGLAHAAAPEWSRQAGLDVWNIAEDQTDLASAEERCDELTDTQQRLFRQIEAGDHVAARLVEGELTLAAAVEELARINRDRHGFGDALESQYPEPAAYRERLARYAIDKAQRRLVGDPTRQADVIDRLELEYAALGEN